MIVFFVWFGGKVGGEAVKKKYVNFTENNLSFLFHYILTEEQNNRFGLGIESPFSIGNYYTADLIHLWISEAPFTSAY